MDPVEEILHKIYYAPGTGFQSAARTLAFVRRAHPNSKVTLAQVTAFVKKQELTQLHQVKHRPKHFRPIVAEYRDKIWMTDLVDLPKLVPDNNFRYIMTIVDVFTRYAWAVPLKNKKGVEVTNAFRDLFRKEGRMPTVLVSDYGKEFVNKDLKKLLETENVDFTPKNDPTHRSTSIVERFNRTLKTQLHRYFTATGRNSWVNVLPEMVLAYNESKHAGIRARPVDVSQGLADPFQRPVPKSLLKDEIPLGSKVRIPLAKHAFTKGYVAQWSKEIYTVVKKTGHLYVLADGKGVHLKRGMRDYELQVLPEGPVQKASAGDKEIADLRSSFTVHAQGKRVPKKKVIEDLGADQ